MDKFNFKDKVRFGVLSTPVQEKDLKLDAYLHQIVLKRPDHTVIDNGFTGLEQYACPYSGVGITYGIKVAPQKEKLQYICKCLNYLLYHERIRRLHDVTPDMLYRCFDEYRLSEKNPGAEDFVSQESLNLFVRIVCEFFANMALVNPNMKFNPSDLLQPRFVSSSKNRSGKSRTVFIPIYNKHAIPCVRAGLLREIPEEAIEMLMDEIRKHDPMIYFAAILQAYAGLRAGECMNLRREGSPLSATPGIMISYTGPAVSKIELDLTREFRMRSDNVDVGKIKRITDRLTIVYEKNLQIVFDAYQHHKELLKNHSYEADYAPMFVLSSGMAMTTSAYQRRFHQVVKEHLKPILQKSSKPELKVFGDALETNNFPTHGLRHYFSVCLALNGLDAAAIKAYRGDRNVDSALVYLQNKGILRAQLETAHTIALAGLTEKGEYVKSP